MKQPGRILAQIWIMQECAVTLAGVSIGADMRMHMILRQVSVTVFCLWAVTSAGQALAAAVACTPTTGYNHCMRYTASGADQTFTVPNGVSSLEIRAWGAAGGGGNSAYWTLQAGGAGGGFSRGILAVSAGQSYIVVVGQGGIPRSTTTTYGGGGAGGAGGAASVGASGGGYSGIFLTSVSAANARIIAGGGGGASPGSGPVGSGGGGGAAGGQDGVPGSSGRGGTQTTGGAAAVTVGNLCTTQPTAGTALQGGTGSSGAIGTGEGGGGGGGGWFGGGGGMCQTSASEQNGSGGGGAGYTSGTGVTAGSTVVGQNFAWSSGNCSGSANSGGASDALYTTGIGVGSCYGAGGAGEVTIQWNTPQITLTKTSLGGGGNFTFSGNNGWTSQIITTPAAGGNATGATQILTEALTATTITETIPATYQLTGVTCSGLGPGGTYTPNLSTGAVFFDAAAMSSTANIACTFTNAKRPILRLQKALPLGRFAATDQFALSIAGAGGPANVTTSGSGTTATGVATVSAGAAGASYTLSEIAAAGASLGNYTTTYSCTNALSGGQIPSGSGTSIVLTAAAGDDLACTMTNIRNSRADLSVTKTNTPASGGSDLAADTVVSGMAVSYAIVVVNSGPDAANDSVVKDPVPVGLTCATATCGSVTGGAVCPALGGAAMLAALQSAAGLSVATLPAGGSLTLTVSCSVD